MRPVELLPIKGLRVRREVANLPTPAGPQAPLGLSARASPVCDSAQRCHAGGARYGHGSPDLSKVECPSLQYAEKSKISFRHRSPLRARLRYSTQDSKRELRSHCHCDPMQGIRSTLHNSSKKPSTVRHCKRIRMRKLTVNLRIVDISVIFHISTSPGFHTFSPGFLDGDREGAPEAASAR